MDLAHFFADTQIGLGSAFDAIRLAEDEISAAQKRHPGAADRIWDSFLLLTPTNDLLTRNDLVFRSHCQELLDRVAAGTDTRPGTAAECCVALCEISQRTPLTTAAAGLYARMWQHAGLPPTELGDTTVHYEALEGALIDDHEQILRTKLRQPERQLPPQ